MSDEIGSGAGLSDARNLLGFVVAGFAGVLNFIGLKSAEIGVVLRNEPFEVSIVGILLLTGVLAAALSVFVTKQHPVHAEWWFGPAVLAASAFPVVIWIIPASTPEAGGVAMGVAIAFWVSALVLLGLGLRAHPSLGSERGLHNKFPDLFNLQCLLLAVAVLLTSAAAYGALRMETISQTSPLAQIGETLTSTGQQDDITISISASKMSDREWLGLDVEAAPRSWGVIATRCQGVQAIRGVRCSQDPCYYFQRLYHWNCAQLSEDVLPPDAAGAVQRSIVVPFSAQQFQHVQITAFVCQPATGTTAGGKKVPPGTCQPSKDAVNSRVDVAIPAAPPS